MSWLRPHPHRGDVIAAGAVPLALAAFVIDIRMTQWSTGARFFVVGLIAVLLLALGWLAELEGETPRAYHSVLLVSGLLPLILTLSLLSRLLGAHGGAGATTWTFALETCIAALAARRANSGSCTLVAALAGAVAVEAFVSWAFNPHGIGTFRAFLLLLTIVYAGGAVQLRDSRRRHAVQLVNAGGLLTIALGATLVAQSLLSAAAGGFHQIGLPVGVVPATASFGWKLYMLAIGFGLIAYAGGDHERGPGYIGVAVLALFAYLVGISFGGRGSLVGWPLFLLVIGGAGLAVGLRPREPLPPPPAGEPAPTVPLTTVPPPEDE